MTCCASVRFNPFAPRRNGIRSTRGGGDADDAESAGAALNRSIASRSFFPPPAGCSTSTPFARNAAATTRSASSHSGNTSARASASAPGLASSNSQSTRRATASTFVPHDPRTTFDASPSSCSRSVPSCASMTSSFALAPAAGHRSYRTLDDPALT
eukprot:31396-Pelagococcus_subviridis.AAC.5